jgi:hypothetical protein
MSVPKSSKLRSAQIKVHKFALGVGVVLQSPLGVAPPPPPPEVQEVHKWFLHY